MPIRSLSPEILSAALVGLEIQKRQLDSTIAEIRAMLKGRRPVAAEPSVEPHARPKRGMSAAGRKRIGDAQRKRWAASKALSRKSAPTKSGAKVARKSSVRKKKMTASSAEPVAEATVA